MQPTLSRRDPIERTATAVWLLAVALAAAAIGLGGELPDPRLIYLGAGYVAIAGALWWLTPRLAWGWLAYLIALVDVSAVTALLALSLATPLPLWVLYLLPVIGASAAGPAPAAWAAGLGAAAYLGVTWLSFGTISLPAIWPVIVLAAVVIAVFAFFAGRPAERQERRAWQEIAAAGRALAGRDEPEEAAAAVVDRARRLARADRAWLWWYMGGGPAASHRCLRGSRSRRAPRAWCGRSRAAKEA